MSELELQLGEAELEVLNILWDEGTCTVRDVMQHLHNRGRAVAYTTVMTFLSRLEQKGYAKSDKSDLAYVYKAAVAREKVRHSRLQSLVEQLYNGSACPLVLQLMETEKFTREEISQLQSLIDQLDTASKSKRKKK